MVNPPSTIITWPVEYIKFPLASDATTFPTSSGSPHRFCTHKPSFNQFIVFFFYARRHISTDDAGPYFKNRNIKFTQPYRKQLRSHTESRF